MKRAADDFETIHNRMVEIKQEKKKIERVSPPPVKYDRYRESWERRLILLEKCQDNRVAQAIQMEMCKRDPIYWFENFVVTYDPRLAEKGLHPYIPFDLFPRQKELIKFLEDRLSGGEEGLIEKSRDMGFTWIAGGFCVHHWLFRPGFKAAFGSRKEELVDKKGDPNSIFGKIRILLDKLPKWMMPAGFNPKEHDNFRLLINPANGATIAGEAGEEIGRGGRAAMFILDEAAFVENDKKLAASLNSSANCRILASTVNGMGNLFAEKRFGGSLRPDQIFRLYWRDDPRKDLAWEEKKKKEFADSPWAWASEYEIDYSASVEAVCIPAKWVQAARDLHDRFMEEGKRPFGPGMAGLDIGGGKSKSVFIGRFGPWISPPEAWGDGDTTTTAFMALEFAKQQKIRVINFDAPGVGAGVLSTLSQYPSMEVSCHPKNTGNPATWQTQWPDGATSRDRFGNLKAEIWFIMRERFRRSYEHLMFLKGEGDTEHELSECILLPNHNQLQVELSIPRLFRNGMGKMVIETKQQLSSRNIASPDFADALALCFIPENNSPMIASPIIETVSRMHPEFATKPPQY